jgi:NAD(P)H-dependent FMN reductase
MKKKILGFGASNSTKSINKTFAAFTANQIKNVEVTLVDLNQYRLPLYSVDLEEQSGIPENAKRFNQLILDSDAIVISLAEHNGLPTAAFKNLIDWLSRIDQKIWKNKAVLLLSTSPGGRGGKSVMNIMKNLIPFEGGKLAATFSLPSFYDHFSSKGISDSNLEEEYRNAIREFETEINK